MPNERQPGCSDSGAMLRWSPTPRPFTEPESIADGWDQIAVWLDAEPVWTPA